MSDYPCRIVCDESGQQRTVRLVRRDHVDWWVVVDPRNGDALSGGFESPSSAWTELARQTAALPTMNKLRRR